MEFEPLEVHGNRTWLSGNGLRQGHVGTGCLEPKTKQCAHGRVKCRLQHPAVDREMVLSPHSTCRRAQPCVILLEHCRAGRGNFTPSNRSGVRNGQSPPARIANRGANIDALEQWLELRLDLRVHFAASQVAECTRVGKALVGANTVRMFDQINPPMRTVAKFGNSEC